MLGNLWQQAESGIMGVFDTWWVFLIFAFFLLWISVKDYKTKTIKNYQNAAFAIAGCIIVLLSSFGVVSTTLSLGWGHFWGMVTGFLVLFIPGMILNYRFGGDIKFVTVLGFWIGGSAILLLLLCATLLQLLFLLLYRLMKKEKDNQISLPFAPAFSISYVTLLLIYLI